MMSLFQIFVWVVEEKQNFSDFFRQLKRFSNRELYIQWRYICNTSWTFHTVLKTNNLFSNWTEYLTLCIIPREKNHEQTPPGRFFVLMFGLVTISLLIEWNHVKNLKFGSSLFKQYWVYSHFLSISWPLTTESWFNIWHHYYYRFIIGLLFPV